MCYPKPGPRCSAHAAATYAKAHQKVLDAFYRGEDDKVVAALIVKRKAAEKEYSITPAGILELERKTNEGSLWAEAHLTEAKQLREERLTAVHGIAEKQHSRRKRTVEAYSHQEFPVSGDVIRPIPYSSPDVIASMNNSAAWGRTLTDEELEAVAWYSQYGYTVVNGHLKQTSSPFNEDAKHYAKDGRVENQIELLDSALAKHAPHPEGVMVYRRQLFYQSNNKLDHTPGMEQETFKPGTVYEPGFYMSTSLNPRNLPEEGFVTALQIRTKTGVPLTSVSSEGPREYEFLIPRTAKFKVIANNVKVIVEEKGKQTTSRVVQLEEI